MLVKERQRDDGSRGRFRWTSKPVDAIRRMVRSTWALVKEHRRGYLLLNLAYYGLMAAAMIYAALSVIFIM
jgi:hypothetical protein